jgi:tol-pal system protein YbgF
LIGTFSWNCSYFQRQDQAVAEIKKQIIDLQKRTQELADKNDELKENFQLLEMKTLENKENVKLIREFLNENQRAGIEGIDFHALKKTPRPTGSDAPTDTNKPNPTSAPAESSPTLTGNATPNPQPFGWAARKDFSVKDGKLTEPTDTVNPDAKPAAASDTSAPPPASPAAEIATKESVRSNEGEASYEEGLTLYNSGQYALAIFKFLDFVSSNPDDEKAVTVHFRIADSYFHLKEYSQAIAEYRKIVETYPENPIIPDAMFNLAECYVQLGEVQDAAKILYQIQDRYPDSSAAKKSLEQIKHYTNASRKED